MDRLWHPSPTDCVRKSTFQVNAAKWTATLGLLIATACSGVGGPGDAVLPGSGDDAGKTVIYRDTWGIPHIYAPDADSGCYAMGWAQAADRPEELLKNFLRGMGEVARVEGERGYQSDLLARTWDNYGVARENVGRIDGPVRSCLQAYAAGINAFYGANPADLPAWWGERQVDEFMVIAFGRYFLNSWSIDDGFADLGRAGIRPGTEPEAKGSNQFAVGPGRSAHGVPILAIDPHLSWWGASRFWEFRIHAGPIQGSGFTLPGQPSIGLGHNQHLAWAMTTGGPDTADVFRLPMRPGTPPRYRFEGEWRPFESRPIEIEVRDEPQARRTTLLVSHLGPVVAVKNGQAYVLRTSYAQEVEAIEFWYRLAQATDYRGAVEALSGLQVFPQNVMVADTSGNIYYQRTGRVPRRRRGLDWSRPVDGSDSANVWTEMHPAEDLVQLLNPEQGYMQNCNIPPDVMLAESPLTPDNYADYIFSDRSHGELNGWSNLRGSRAVELLERDTSILVDEAKAIILDVQPYSVDRWLFLLMEADRIHGDAHRGEPGYQAALAELLNWNGELRRDSTAALKYYFWRRQIYEDLGEHQTRALVREIDDLMAPFGGGRAGSTERYREALAAFPRALRRLAAELGPQATYGDLFRVGRGERSWPVGGGGSHLFGTTTLRNVGFGSPLPDGNMRGGWGQTITQVVLLSDPVQSWTAAPIGQSDRPDSPHYTDQAEKLFSPRKLKPTWWLPRDLAGNIESRLVLNP